MQTIQQQARAAGFLYLALAVTAPIGLLYVPGKLIVPRDAAATAENLRASEGLLRLGIASELFHQVMVVFLVLALYRLFKPVSETLAKQLVVLGALVSVPIMFVNVLNELAAIVLAKGGGFLTPFEQPQRDALAYLFLHLHGQGIKVTSIFWGLWLFPFGLLVIRSGFIPPVLGALLLVAGAAYLVDSFVRLIVPSVAPAVTKVTDLLVIAEVPIILWLVIRGASPRPDATT